MLAFFSVENFLSFAARRSLDLRVSDAESPDSTTRLVANNAWKIDRHVLIRGGPGSGKTNLLRALGFLRRILLQGRVSVVSSHGLPSCRFAKPLQPTCFALGVRLSDRLFQYEASFTVEQVHHERLGYQIDGQDYQLVFERRMKHPILALVDTELGPGARADADWFLLAQTEVSPHELFLSAAILAGVPTVRSLSVWLNQGLQLLFSDLSAPGLASRVARVPNVGELLTECLQSAGLPAVQVCVTSLPVPPDFFQNETEQANVLSALQRYPDAFVSTGDGELIAVQNHDGESTLRRVVLQVFFRGASGETASFAVAELPETALRIFHLAPLLFPKAEAQAVCFVVDKWSVGLPEATQAYILKKALGHGTQLILTDDSADGELAFLPQPG